MRGVFVVVSVFVSVFACDACDLFVKGYYKPVLDSEIGTRIDELPNNNSAYNFLSMPENLSCTDLENLHKQCVVRINEYRLGQRNYSNHSVPLPGKVNELIHSASMDKCHSEITMGDFILMNPRCVDGAHANAWSCNGYNDAWGQNECCPQGISDLDVYNSTLIKMYGCLQAMWDQGMHPGVGKTTHWENMIYSGYNYVSCGFAFGTNNNGRLYVIITQNYGGTLITKKPTKRPTRKPTRRPTKRPTRKPTRRPTKRH